MEYEDEPTCPNCYEKYFLGAHSRIPLMLSCGHTYCSPCLVKMGRVQQQSGAIACPECAVPTKFGGNGDQLIPNLHLLGIVAAKHLKLRSVPVYNSVSSVLAEGGGGGRHYRGRDSPLYEGPYVSSRCEECESSTAHLKCVQCNGLYCNTCFAVVHASSKAMRKHASIPVTQALSSREPCSEHPTEYLKHFCEQEETPVCSSCTITGTHKGHPVVALNTAAENYRETLEPLLAMARRQLQDMKAVEKRISGELPRVGRRMLSTVRELHSTFNDLFVLLQRRELALLEELARACEMEAEPLLTTRESLQQTVQKVTSVVSIAQDVLGDDLKLVKTAKKLIAELSAVEVPQYPLYKPETVKFNLDGAVQTQLLEIGSICHKASKGSHLQLPCLEEEYITADEDYSDSSLTFDPQHTPLHKPVTPSGSPPSRASPSELCNGRSKTATPRETLNKVKSGGSSRGASPMPRKNGSRSVSPRVDQLRGERKGSRSRSASPKWPTVNLEDTAEVWVCHIENPSEFYVQYPDSMEGLRGVMEQVNDYCRRPRPLKKKDVVPGVRCAAKFSGDPDQIWYRAIVESVHLDSPSSPLYATVLYTDYGNTELVTHGSQHFCIVSFPLQKLGDKPIKFTVKSVSAQTVPTPSIAYLPEDLISTPPFCSKCSLFQLLPCGRYQNLAPADWSHRAITQFKSVLRVDSGPLRMKVFETEDSGLLHVDLYLPSVECLFSVCEKLVSMGLAKKEARASRREEAHLPPPATLTVGETISVVVPTVHNPGDFYVQLASSAGDLNELRDELDREFSSSRPSRAAPIIQPWKGMICCAQYAADKLWYRAEIIDKNGGETVKVKFVDYGNSEQVPLSSLATIPPHLLTLPVQAVRCCLHDVEGPGVDGQWSEEGSDCFYDLVTFYEEVMPTFSCTVRGEGSPVPVVLTDRETSQSISSILVVQELAKYTNDNQQQGGCSPAKSDNHPPSSEGFSPPHIEVTGEEDVLVTNVSPDREEAFSLNGEQLSDDVVRELPPSPLPQVGVAFMCKVISITSPSEFYISLDVVPSEAAMSLTRTLAKIKTTNVKALAWKKGDYALACFLGSQEWHRVVVQEVMGEDLYQVAYVDYGNRDQLQSSAMIPMPDSLYEFHALALKCRLTGVKAAGDVEEWPHNASMLLSHMTMDKTILCSFQALPSCRTSPLPVSLTVHQEGRMDDVASSLITHGYAQTTVDAPPTQLYQNSVKKPKETVTETYRSYPVKGSAMDIGSYLPPSPPPNDHFVLSVTYVSEGGVIHGHILEQDMPLSLVMDRVQKTCHSHYRVHSIDSLVPGQACCAFFTEDGLWYRVVIKGVDQAKNTATVLYVDYGNTDVVQCSQLVNAVVMLNVPVQDFATKLAGTEGVDWTEERLGALAVIVGEDLNGYNVHGFIDGYPAVQYKVNPHGLDLKEELQKRGFLCVKEQEVSAPGGTDDVARRKLEASVVRERSTNGAEPGQQVGDVMKEASVVRKRSTNGAEPGQQVGDVMKEASVVRERSTNGAEPGQQVGDVMKEASVVRERSTNGAEPGQQVSVPEATLTNERESTVIPPVLQEKTVPSREKTIPSQEDSVVSQENGLADGEDTNYSDMELD